MTKEFARFAQTLIAVGSVKNILSFSYRLKLFMNFYMNWK